MTGLTHKTVNTFFPESAAVSPRGASDIRRYRRARSKLTSLTSALVACATSGARGSGGKTIVFGLLKRKGKVYTEIVPDCKEGHASGHYPRSRSPEVVIHSDGWRGYDGLVDVGHSRHFRVAHGANEFARFNYQRP